MRQRLSCPRGHHWEMSGVGFPLGMMACPVCGVVCAMEAVQTKPIHSAWESRTEPEAARPGESQKLPFLPGYEILGRLGEGAMGVVLLARHLRLNRLVAIKLLASGAHAGPRQLARFQVEAEALATLHHPHIVEIYEVGEADHVPYFAMEYVNGGTLAERLNGQPQLPAQAARLLETIARAVHVAHQHGIIHRDLKPGNVLLTGRSDGPSSLPEADDRPPDLFECVPKISDFGLARRLEQTTPGETAVILGTPCYMAPEQGFGDLQAVGTSADIYAQGVILYELLTGRVPFLGPSALATLELARTAEPPSPRSLRPSVPRDLETICLKCLEKEPGKRYPSAEALADDLRRFLNHEPVHARATPFHERIVKWVRRRPASAALLGVVVLATALLGVILWSNARQREAARASARFRIAHTVNDMYTQVAEKWLANEPEMDPVQREFLEKALALYQELVREEPTNPALRREHGLAYFRVGQIYRVLGKPDQAEQAYRQALSLQGRLHAESPGQAEYRQDLANTHNWLGELLRAGGRRLQEAEQAYRAALRLQQRLVEDFPGQPAYQRDLARSHDNLGLVLAATGRFPEAGANHDQAIASLEQLRQEVPDEPDYRHDLARGYLNQGVLHEQTRRDWDAETDYDRSIGLLEGLTQQLPSRPLCRYELALARTGRANLLQRRPAALIPSAAWAWGGPHGTVAECSLALWLARSPISPARLPEAETDLRRAHDLFARLAADFPGRPRYLFEQANCQNSLANVCALQERYGEAEETWRRSLELFAALVKQSPDVADYRSALGRGHGNLGWLHLIQKEPGRACDPFERGLPHLREAVHLNPSNPHYLTALRDLCQNLAEARVLLGDHAEALAAAGEMVQASRAPGPGAHYLAACFAARCRAAARADARVSKADRDALEGRYAGQALAWLREAIGRGYRDAREMRQDSRLRSLHGLPEFDGLLDELDRTSGHTAP